MIIRQEENTPIGDYFHDSGLWTLFNALESSVDDFEVDSEQLNAWCDMMISQIKGLQGKIKKLEKEAIQREHQLAMRDKISRGIE